MTRDQILVQLKAGPQTVEQLQTALSFSYDKTHNSLARLQKAKKVFRLADKRYALAEQVLLINGEPQLRASAPQAPTGRTNTFGPLDNPTVIVPAVVGAPGSPPLPPPVEIVNRRVVVFDRSYSMAFHRNKAHETINQTLESIRNIAAKFPNQRTEVSLYQFNHKVERVFFRRPAAQVERLSGYYPAGDTALLDATWTAIKEHLIAEEPGQNVSTVIEIITDGEENQSRIASSTGLRELIRQVQGTDRWTIAFQVPQGGYKQALVHDFGIPEGNVMEWDKDTDKGFEEAAAARETATMDYMVARAAGATKSTNYYNVQTDLSKVTQADLNKLTNIAGQVKVWTVDKEMRIDDFVDVKLGRSGAYVRGTVFYELTKPEKVQSYKKVVVMKKYDKSQVFGGAEARTLIGLPAGQDARVRPGNHADYDVFNQSTSNNRLLPRGAKVIYWPNALSV